MEWVIEDGMMDPGVARASRETQRKRIMMELEAPLPHAPPPPRLDPNRPAPTPVQKRAELMRVRNFYEKDPERKSIVNERIREMLIADRANRKP